MASKEIAKKNGDNDDDALRDRQLAALERLHDLGAAPRPPEGAYSGDPQIRALQLVYEGRFGGPGRNQGRPRQRGEPRAAEVIAEEIRHRFTGRMTRALERALRREAGVRANLDAVKLALEIENREAALQIKEAEVDLESATKEELLVTLFEIIGQPQTTAAIEGTAFDITEAEVVKTGDERGDNERAASNGHSPIVGENGSDGDPARSGKAGRHARSARTNGGRRSKRDRSESTNPFTEAALRGTEQ
jgi:hypothetical protein